MSWILTLPLFAPVMEVTSQLAPVAITWEFIRIVNGESQLRVGPPPKGFPTHYTQYVSARGFPVLGSAKVSPYALLEAGWLINQMLDTQPEVRRAMIRNRCRFVVMAATEWTTDVPEHSDLKPKNYWDRRARGLGATRVRPAVSCGEENLLSYPGDPYAAENILIHEFAHAIHLMGLNNLDRSFDARLRACYESAMRDGLWKDKYAASHMSEYWAEGVQSWFDTNRPPDHDHNHVNTREELKQYDPRLAELIASVFGDHAWRYRRPSARPETERQHLVGYDAKDAPRFTWPDHLKQQPPRK